MEEAAAEIEGFYRNYHSQRYVRDSLVLRMRHPLPETTLAELSAAFTDILTGRRCRRRGR